MSTRTLYLSLELPNNGEYRDSWNIPTNSNFEKIDTAYGNVSQEVQDARFSKTTLQEFLAVSHETDGSLKPTEEVENTRNSFLYGHKDGTTPLTLDTLSFKKDRNMWDALEGQSSLRDSLAYRQSNLPDQVLSGSKDVNGYPAWMGYAGAKVTIDGSAVAINVLINGYRTRIRTEKDTTISGAVGTYYVYAQYEPDGQAIVTGTPASCGLDSNNDIRIHSHHNPAGNYVTDGVQVGDLLRYNSPAVVEGEYLIEEVAPSGNVDQLLIRNTFAEATSSIDYEIRDPLAVTLGFTDDPSTLTANQFIMGEADFDGAAVTAVRPRHFGETFVSEWRAIDVSSVADFEEIFNHYMGTDILDVTIQASHANDGSEAVEELSLAKINNTLGVSTTAGTLAVGITDSLTHSITNTLVTQSANGPDAHTHIVGGSGTLEIAAHGGSISASVTGTPSSSLTGDVTPYNSVAMKASRNKIWIKNAVSSLFYRDYDNAVRQTGYLRVIVTKKG